LEIKSIKKSNNRICDFQFDEIYLHCRRVMHPNLMRTKGTALGTLQDFALFTSSSGCLFESFIISFKIVNISVDKNSMSHYNKPSNQRKSMREFPVCNQIG
jgi:hypothetical protein